MYHLNTCMSFNPQINISRITLRKQKYHSFYKSMLKSKKFWVSVVMHLSQQDLTLNISTVHSILNLTVHAIQFCNIQNTEPKTILKQ